MALDSLKIQEGTLVNKFASFFTHNQNDEPLVFTQMIFWLFFAGVLLVYALVYKRIALRNIYLLLVSIFFYYKTSGVFTLLLLFTILSDFGWGWFIHNSKEQWKKKLGLTFSLILNLGLLCYFKYAFFFTESYNQLVETKIPFINHFSQFSNSFFGTDFNISKVILPIGISFFTFQSISYVVDVYREKVKPVKYPWDYGFFVCFFPHLVAGPIVKANEFIHQIYQPYNLTRFEFGMALFWIVNGLIKKILADFIAINFIDRIFSAPGYYSGVECVLGIFSYSLQIYADFSGYTDMAIGIALLLGFRLKTNFNSPYKAASTSEFWQRWHISLSSWLKEYLYIPLGGNKKGSWGSYIIIFLMCAIVILLSKEMWLTTTIIIGSIAMLLFALSVIFSSLKKQIDTNINIIITMLLGGLWHGSSWFFIIWGGLNGIGLMIHKIWLKIMPKSVTDEPLMRPINIFITLTFISFTRIWFRFGSVKENPQQKLETFFDRIYNHFGAELFFDIIKGYSLVLGIVLLGYSIHWIPEKAKERYRAAFANLPLPALALTVVVFVIGLYQAISSGMQPFIYFQF